MVIFLVFSLTSSSLSSWVMRGLCSIVHQSAAKGEHNGHLFQRCLCLIEEMLTHFNQGNEKIRGTLLQRWSGCDVQTGSCEAWSLLVPPGECSALAHGPSRRHPLCSLHFSSWMCQIKWTTRQFPRHATLSQPCGCPMVQIYLTLHPLGEPSLTSPAWTMPPS